METSKEFFLEYCKECEQFYIHLKKVINRKKKNEWHFDNNIIHCEKEKKIARLCSKPK